MLRTILLIIFLLSLSAGSVSAKGKPLKQALLDIQAAMANENIIPIGASITKLQSLSNSITLDNQSADQALMYKLLSTYSSQLYRSLNEPYFSRAEQFLEHPEYGLDIHLYLSMHYIEKGEFNKSIKLLDEVINDKNANNDQKLLAYIYLISAYSGAQTYTPIIDLIENASVLMKSAYDKSAVAYFNYEKAVYYSYLEDNDRAIFHYKTSLMSAIKLKNWTHAIDVSYALGVAYRDQGHYDDAIRFFKKTLSFQDRTDIKFGRYFGTYGVATTYFLQGNLKEAIVTATEAINLPDSPSDFNTELHKELAKVYIDQGRFSEAERHINKAETIFLSMPDLINSTWHLEVSLIRSSLEEKLGNYESAFSLQKDYYHRIQLVKNLEEREMLHKLNAKYAAEESRSQIMKLNELVDVKNTELDTSKQQLATKNRMNVILVIYVFLSTLAGIYLLYLYRNKPPLA